MLSDVWFQYGDKYRELDVLMRDTSKSTSQFIRYQSKHILIKPYTGREKDTYIMYALFPFLKTLHHIKEKFEYIRMFNTTSTSLLHMMIISL